MEMMRFNLPVSLLFCFLIATHFVIAQTVLEEKSAIQATNEHDSATKLKESEPDKLIHIGDLIDVDIVGSTEFDWRGTITPEGFLKVNFYNSEPIYALCKSEEVIAQKIMTVYSKLLRNPQVVVKILDRSNRALSYIYGAVKTPQRLRVQRIVRLNEVIILSGGITEKASGSITILRPPNMDCEETAVVETKYLKFNVKDIISGNFESNPIIKIGDIITIEESEPIYVIGGVKNPKQYLYREDLTLSRLILMSGGFSKDANPQNIIIYRRTENETKLINIDFNKIKLLQFEDIELEKYDIIEIGQNSRNKNRPNPKLSITLKGEQTANLPLKIID